VSYIYPDPMAPTHPYPNRCPDPCFCTGRCKRRQHNYGEWTTTEVTPFIIHPEPIRKMVEGDIFPKRTVTAADLGL